MSVIYHKGVKYYSTRREAEAKRRKGDRIYFEPNNKGYYIVRPTSKAFWQ